MLYFALANSSRHLRRGRDPEVSTGENVGVISDAPSGVLDEPIRRVQVTLANRRQNQFAADLDLDGIAGRISHLVTARVRVPQNLAHYFAIPFGSLLCFRQFVPLPFPSSSLHFTQRPSCSAAHSPHALHSPRIFG
jgi:hypothetical protein